MRQKKTTLVGERGGGLTPQEEVFVQDLSAQCDYDSNKVVRLNSNNGGLENSVLKVDDTGNYLVWSSINWGEIGGSLSNQADLQDALNQKGDVFGPDLATNGAIVLFDGSSGKVIKDSAKTLPLEVGSGGTGATTPAGARANLGLAIGSDVQAYDDTLQSLSSLGTAADKIAYTTGVDTWAETALTAFGRSLIDDADAATARATLGLGNLALENSPLGVTKGGTGLTSIASGKLLYASASNVLSELTLGSTLAISSGTLNVQNNTSTQKAEIAKAGALVGTRKRLNFVEGSNVTLTIADDAANDRVNITIATAGSNHNLLSTTHPDTVAASPVLGDIIYANSTPAWTKLAGNTTTTKKFLTQTGTGTVSAAPSWDTISASDINSGVLPITYGGTGASTANGARSNLGAAASGINSDITALQGLNQQNAVRVGPWGASAGNTGEVRFLELAANGSNYVGFKAPDNIASNIIWVLPSSDGANGQVLTTNGSGVLSWTTPSSGFSPFVIQVISPTDWVTGGNAAGGSGSNTNNNYSVEHKTGTTAGSYAYVRFLAATNSAPLLAPGVVWRQAIYLSPTTTASAFHSLFGIGGTDAFVSGTSGIDYTKKHIGFKITRSGGGSIELRATQANGTTETASDVLTTLTAGDSLYLVIKINSGSVDYYWKKHNGSWSSATTLSTNIPPDFGGYSGALVSGVHNVNSAAQASFWAWTPTLCT